MAYITYSWWFGGWFIIVLLTLTGNISTYPPNRSLLARMLVAVNFMFFGRWWSLRGYTFENPLIQKQWLLQIRGMLIPWTCGNRSQWQGEEYSKISKPIWSKLVRRKPGMAMTRLALSRFHEEAGVGCSNTHPRPRACWSSHRSREQSNIASASAIRDSYSSGVHLSTFHILQGSRIKHCGNIIIGSDQNIQVW